jgi:hypothetical protein
MENFHHEGHEAHEGDGVALASVRDKSGQILMPSAKYTSQSGLIMKLDKAA